MAALRMPKGRGLIQGRATVRIKMATRPLRQRIDKWTYETLKDYGAYTRKVAKNSMRKRGKRISVPGKPPNVHTGHLKRLLFFAVDRSIPSVVIGPQLRPGSIAAKALEYGGRSFGKVPPAGTTRTPQPRKPGRPKRSRRSGLQRQQSRRYFQSQPYVNANKKTKMVRQVFRVRPRPYMDPAFQRTLAVKKIQRDSLHRIR